MNTKTNNKAIPGSGVEELQAATAALDALHENMAFLKPLAATERQHTKKVGLQTLRTTEQRLKIARENPEAMPAGFDLPQFEQDVAWTEGLIACLAAVDRLRRDVQDTLMTVGSRAGRTGVEVYAYVRAGSGSASHLHQAATRLRRPRPRLSRKTPEPASSPGAGATTAAAPAVAGTLASPATPEVKAA